MKFIIFIVFSLSMPCLAQTYEELQLEIEQEKLRVYGFQLSRVEVYSFKNRKDSTINSYKLFDSEGNVVSSRQYVYKSRKLYNEQIYEYDTLGRRIKVIHSSSFIDKLNKAKGSTHEKYVYRADSLIKIIIESYKDDELVRSKEYTERKKEPIVYKKMQVDSLDRLVSFENYSVVGLEKHAIKYHANGKIESDSCYVDDQLWYVLVNNEFGNVGEYKEWLYDSKSHKLIEHSFTYYNDLQQVLRIEFLNRYGKTKEIYKYYYFRND